MRTALRRASMVVGLAAFGVVVGFVPAYAQVDTQASDAVTGATQSLRDTLVHILVIVLPTAAAIWAIMFGVRKALSFFRGR